MIAKKLIMYPDNDQEILIKGLQDLGTGNYFDDTAIVSATLYDQANNPVPGCIGITLSYVVGSLGNFQGEVEETFSPPLGGGYSLVVLANQGGADAKWTLLVEIELRRQ